MSFFRRHSALHGPYVPSRRLLIFWLFTLTFTLIPGTLIPGNPVSAESNEATAVNAAFGPEYAVQGGPRNMVAEAPGRIWYTATEGGGVGFLEVISDEGEPIVRYRTEFYGFDIDTGRYTYPSQPYDIVLADGFVWFTLRGIRSLGKIDIETRETTVYPLLSVGAAPTGLDVDPSGNLWIAQSNGRISRFDPTTEQFIEFIMPLSMVGQPRMEDIVYQNSRSVWMTMPDANSVVVYDPVRDRFFNLPTGEIAPMEISIDPDGRVWVTAYGSNRIGRYTPTTVSIWFWFDAPAPDGGAAGILTFKDENGILQIWITENKAGKIARFQFATAFNLVNTEELGPTTPPGNSWGIILAPDDHIWVADSTRNLLYELKEPYIQRIYLSAIENSPSTPE